MPWFKVDDGFHSHPKSTAIPLAAVGLWAVAGSWSSHHLTDGFVPDHQIPLLSRGDGELAERLVAAGLWRRTKGGYQFHQWTEDSDGTRRNPAADEVRELRRKRAEAGRKGGRAKALTSANSDHPGAASSKPGSKPLASAKQVAKQNASNGIGSGTYVPSPSSDSLRESSDTDSRPPSKRQASARKGEPVGVDRFDEFYDAYGNKQAREDARKAWAKALKDGADPDQLITAAHKHRDHHARIGTDKQYRKYPASWLRSQCWLDELPDPTSPAKNGHEPYRNPTDQSVYDQEITS